MSTLLLAFALLCGVPVGVIIGLVLGSRLYRATRRRRDGGDVDYSGGV